MSSSSILWASVLGDYRCSSQYRITNCRHASFWLWFFTVFCIKNIHPARCVVTGETLMRGRSISALPSIDAIRPITNEYAIPAIGPSRSSILDRAYSKRLAQELERVSKPRIEPERKLLKRDLLKIYQKKTKKKKKYSSKKIAPWDELNDQLSVQVPITSLTSIHAKYHDLGSYNKDYILLAREYKRMEKYRIHPREIETDHQLSCVTCSRRGGLDRVFFPCQHRCVCSNCQDKMKPKQCPLCHVPIMIILDNTENVYEEYWIWVDQVRMNGD